MKIISKSQSVKLYESGFFGNKGLTWPTSQAYYKSGYKDYVVLRYRDPNYGGGICIYNLRGQYDVHLAIRECVRKGCKESLIWINAQMPDYAIVNQGEYWVSDGTYIPVDLYYCSEAKLQMRDALAKESKHVTGFSANEMFKRKMDHKSWSNFQRLKEKFPGHIIEISIYDRSVGLLKWNSVVWEVRSY